MSIPEGVEDRFWRINKVATKARVEALYHVSFLFLNCTAQVMSLPERVKQSRRAVQEGNLQLMRKRFLVLQLRPETDAADDEFAAILRKGGLETESVRRIRLDQEPLPPELNLDDYAGLIVGGGPGCVSDPPDQKKPVEARIEADILSLMPVVTERDYPFLGCCYGIGILGKHLEARVGKEAYSEPVGTASCDLTDAGKHDPLLDGVPAAFDAFVGHKEALQELPDGCVHLVRSGTCPYQMFRFGTNVYATQFHPEADADGFETRINIYKNHGYFPPEDAEKLINACRSADVFAPEIILRNFVRLYGEARR